MVSCPVLDDSAELQLQLLCRFQSYQWASRARITSFGCKHDLPVQLLVALPDLTPEQGVSLGRNRVTHRLPILIPENSLKAWKQIGFLPHHMLAVVGNIGCRVHLDRFPLQHRTGQYCVQLFDQPFARRGTHLMLAEELATADLPRWIPFRKLSECDIFPGMMEPIRKLR